MLYDARAVPLLVLAAFCAATAGCGGDLSRVEGRVTLDGEPVAGARVVFMAVGSAATGVAVSDEDGNYAVSTGTQTGIKPGKYQVAVSKYKTRPNKDELLEPEFDLLTPATYNNPETSGFEVEITRGTNHYDFAMKSR